MTYMLQAAKYGAEKDLIRFSVGLEDSSDLLRRIDLALRALDQASVE